MRCGPTAGCNGPPTAGRQSSLSAPATVIGKSFEVGADDDVIEGLGLLDVTTTRGPVRAVGEILSRWEDGHSDEQWLTGFENHGRYTRLGPEARPLASGRTASQL